MKHTQQWYRLTTGHKMKNNVLFQQGFPCGCQTGRCFILFFLILSYFLFWVLAGLHIYNKKTNTSCKLNEVVVPTIVVTTGSGEIERPVLCLIFPVWNRGGDRDKRNEWCNSLQQPVKFQRLKVLSALCRSPTPTPFPKGISLSVWGKQWIHEPYYCKKISSSTEES